jgi:hypothetical protein
MQTLIERILSELSMEFGIVDFTKEEQLQLMHKILIKNGIPLTEASNITNYFRISAEDRQLLKEKKVKEPKPKRNTVEQAVSMIGQEYGIQTGAKSLYIGKNYDINALIDKLNTNDSLKSILNYEHAKELTPDQPGAMTSSMNTLALYNAEGNIIYKFKLTTIFSATGGEGEEGTGEIPSDLYELGIAVAYNMLMGADKETALIDAGITKKIALKKFNSFEQDILPIGQKIASKIKADNIMEWTGGKSSFDTSPLWPSDNKTPKTDLYSGAENRISLKKMGGSQLMSGGKGDTAGVFKAALKYYDVHDGARRRTLISEFIKDVENKFKYYNTISGSTVIKQNLVNQWTEKRINEILDELTTKEIRGTGINTEKQRIERARQHAIAELIQANLSDFHSNYKSWFINGIEDKSISAAKWFKEEFLATVKNSDIVAGMINTAVDHRELTTKLDTIFKKDPEFKKWIIYEAATGCYKFTGDVQDTILMPVANKILSFSIDGDAKMIPITVQWAKQLSDTVVTNVGYKTSNGRTESSFRILVKDKIKNENIAPIDEQPFEFEIAITEIIADSMDRTINIFDVLNTEIDLLEEGSWKDGLKNAWKSIVDTVERFYKIVISKIIQTLFEYAEKGIQYFANALGIEIVGEGYADVEF